MVVKLVKDLKITKIGEERGVGIYEIEVPQDEDTTYAYITSEPSLKWLIDNDKSQWEVKYFASSLRKV